jgi:putative ABC transport system ATP-binding protein
MNDVLLRLENIKKAYVEPTGESLPILDIPAFQVARGEQTVLVGRSGCGKTTLLHVIAGITRADAGTILIDGVDVARLSEAGRDRFRAAKIGYVFQTFNLLPGFTALENVLLGMTFARGRKDTAWARHLLERVGLAHRATHKPAALSVGEQQRVAVARALANHPSLLLADEPTAALDSHRGRQVMELFRKVAHERGAGVIVVTHDQRALDIFDRIFEMEDGRLRPTATASGVQPAAPERESARN